jgi:hypothetical protein
MDDGVGGCHAMHFVVKWPSVKKPVKRASVENSRTPIPFFGSLSLHIGDKRFNEIALWLANINCAHRFEREKKSNRVDS